MANMAWSDIQNTVNGEYVPMEEAEKRIAILELQIDKTIYDIRSLSYSINYGPSPRWEISDIIVTLDRLAERIEDLGKQSIMISKIDHDAIVGELNRVDLARRQECHKLADTINGQTDAAEKMRNSLHWIADAEKEDLL